MQFHSLVPALLGVLILAQSSVLAQEDADRARRITERLRDAYLQAYNAHDAAAVAAIRLSVAVQQRE